MAVAVLEGGCFGLLYLVINLLADENYLVPSLAGLIGASGSRQSFVARCAMLLLGLFMVRTVATYSLLRLQASLQADADEYLGTELFRHYQSMTYIDLLRRNSAELVANVHSRTTDVATNAVGTIVIVATDGAVLLGVGVTMAVIKPLLAAGTLAFLIVVAVGFMKMLVPALRQAAQVEHYRSDVAVATAQESILGSKAIQASGLVGPFVERYKDQRVTLAEARKTRMFLMRLPQFYLETTLFLGLSFLAILARSDSADLVATFGLLVAAAFRLLPSLRRLVGAASGLRATEPSLDAIDSDLKRAQAAALAGVRMKPGPRGTVRLTRCLEIVGVSYSYPTALESALEGVNLKVPAGEWIGIVGASGAGKTTLADIVTGLLIPSRGELRVDGMRLGAETIASWRQNLGYLPQEVFLLDGTLRENIVFGRPNIDDAVLTETIHLAQLTEVVASLPGGLDARVGERGMSLSGGQRQRVGIARALLTRPGLLILDEATAALDTDTEAQITDSIASLHGRMTVLIVAHRLSTVRRCDRLVFLERGRVRAIGSFMELLAQDSAFAELVRLGQIDES